MVLMLHGESDGSAKSSCTHFVTGLSLSQARTQYVDKTINNVGVDPSKSNRSRIVLRFNTLRSKMCVLVYVCIHIFSSMFVGVWLCMCVRAHGFFFFFFFFFFFRVIFICGLLIDT